LHFHRDPFFFSAVERLSARHCRSSFDAQCEHQSQANGLNRLSRQAVGIAAWDSLSAESLSVPATLTRQAHTRLVVLDRRVLQVRIENLMSLRVRFARFGAGLFTLAACFSPESAAELDGSTSGTSSLSMVTSGVSSEGSHSLSETLESSNSDDSTTSVGDDQSSSISNTSNTSTGADDSSTDSASDSQSTETSSTTTLEEESGECTAGEIHSCGYPEVGICKTGVQSCIDGQWGACEGGVGPQARDCSSSADNDCDGNPDNAIDAICRCENGTSRSCDTHPEDGIGTCKPGSQLCELGPDGAFSDWGGCVNGTGPTIADKCSEGLDTNCNGLLECDCTPGDVEPCGQCSEGTRTCDTDGVWQACENTAGVAVTYYYDADGDEYGREDMTVVSCTGKPSEYVENGGDCCDSDSNVHPGAELSDVPSKCDGSWDLDCNGTIEPNYPKASACTGTASAVCGRHSGFISEPVCQEEQEWVACVWSSAQNKCFRPAPPRRRSR
jgi:hypothetical protein